MQLGMLALGKQRLLVRAVPVKPPRLFPARQDSASSECLFVLRARTTSSSIPLLTITLRRRQTKGRQNDGKILKRKVLHRHVKAQPISERRRQDPVTLHPVFAVQSYPMHRGADWCLNPSRCHASISLRDWRASLAGFQRLDYLANQAGGLLSLGEEHA